MPRIRAAEPGRSGRRTDERTVVLAGRPAPLSRAAVARIARGVLAREGREARLSISFVGPERMRSLNARWLGRAQPTDVLAFPLPAPGGILTGDIYICRAVAGRHAKVLGLPLAQELRRLVVHGVLHILGWEHPERNRAGSPMWRRQERYLKALR